MTSLVPTTIATPTATMATPTATPTAPTATPTAPTQEQSLNLLSRLVKLSKLFGNFCDEQLYNEVSLNSEDYAFYNDLSRVLTIATRISPATQKLNITPSNIPSIRRNELEVDLYSNDGISFYISKPIGFIVRKLPNDTIMVYYIKPPGQVPHLLTFNDKNNARAIGMAICNDFDAAIVMETLENLRRN